MAQVMSCQPVPEKESSLGPSRLEIILNHAKALQGKALGAGYLIAAERLDQKSPHIDQPLAMAVDVIRHAMAITAIAQQMLDELRPLLQQIDQDEALVQREQLDSPLH